MLLIKNARIYTVAGPVIENGSIVIENGKIKEIGENITINETACTEVINAEGKIITPGFIDAHSHLSLWESSIGFEGSDGNEATHPITPHMRGLDAINPFDITFEEARNAGVTAVAAGPGSANVIGGTFVAIKTFPAKRADELVIKDPVAMKCAFGENPKRFYGTQGKTPSTRMATAGLFRETLFKAKQYLYKLENAKEASKKPKYDAKLEALIPVLKREIPLKAHAHRADDMFTALRIAKEFNLKITLEHATEGHLIADELAKENVYCIVGPSFGHKSKFELQNLTFDTPAILHKAGIKIAITTDAPVIPLARLPLMAGIAVEHGLNEDQALKAITINAAEAVGIEDRVGSLEVGKDADLVIFNNKPFNTNSKVYMTIINGKVVYKK
ncbi:amidohydrolase [Clostridium sp. 'deep sea']|uniref:amidohydrolase n=1 Tax=Clostridium sp. 'deep sea' TaxID=2779445 RepID=UPI0018969723|nr:amidohydrolase [Clostridium sp. 'deep sea']QOR36112.1 amidohydrolase [Clostridium sp. 'deep sea']